MKNAENIVANIISELVVHGMRDRTCKITFDLVRYEHLVVKEVEEKLKLFLKHAPIIVVGGWENNYTLSGLYTIKISWDNKNIEWGVKNEN